MKNPIVSEWTCNALQLYRRSYGLIPPVVFDLEILEERKQVWLIHVKSKSKWFQFPWTVSIGSLLLFVFCGTAYQLYIDNYGGSQKQFHVIETVLCLCAWCGCVVIASLFYIFIRNLNVMPFTNLMLTNHLSYRKYR